MSKEPAKQQSVTEDDVIEFILDTLFNNLDKNEMHLENEILKPTKLDLKEKEIERIRELLMATNLVRNSVGFGKSHNIYLNAAGINAIKTYGSYRNYVKAMQGNHEMPIQNTTTNNTNNKPQKENPKHHVTGGDDMAH